MATILPRKRKDGSTGYMARIRIHEGGKLVHAETKTFSSKSAAKEWAKRREVELENPGALAAARQGEVSLASLVRWYIDTFESVSKWQRSKQSALEFLERHEIGKVNALELSTEILVDHARARRTSGVAGPTGRQRLHLDWRGHRGRKGRAIAALKPEVIDEARVLCTKLRLIGKSARRDRRPTNDELQKLDEHFRVRDRHRSTIVPMRPIMWFAIYSTRREAEICRLEWSDNDAIARTGLVRDAKHPRSKEGNHLRFKYVPEGWAIVEQQPRVSEYIFPYDPKTVCGAFTKACQFLGIVDLHFHDLRHEATSRLFERGYDIQEVAQFSLHRSWTELKRYTNLRPENLREIITLENGERVVREARVPVNTLPCPPASELVPWTRRPTRSPMFATPP